MYAVINKTNNFDPANNLRFATEAEAEAKAVEILNLNPTHVVLTCDLLKSFKAVVTIESGPVVEETPVGGGGDSGEGMPE
jgi:hypothetical protein